MKGGLSFDRLKTLREWIYVEEQIQGFIKESELEMYGAVSRNDFYDARYWQGRTDALNLFLSDLRDLFEDA